MDISCNKPRYNSNILFGLFRSPDIFIGQNIRLSLDPYNINQNLLQIEFFSTMNRYCANILQQAEVSFSNCFRITHSPESNDANAVAKRFWEDATLKPFVMVL